MVHPTSLPRASSPPLSSSNSQSSHNTLICPNSPQSASALARTGPVSGSARAAVGGGPGVPRLSPVGQVHSPVSSQSPPVIGPPPYHKSNTAPDESQVDADDDLDALDDLLLENFLSSDVVAVPPPPCVCHNLPIGSCPTVKSEYVQISLKLQGLPGSPANMDSLRIPLPRLSFPIQAWRFALQGYFDASELLSFLEFGWDFSFLAPPNPKDATKNLASARLAPQDVDIYVDTELAHGALIGPFADGELPFPVFRSPVGTVHKIPVRRTITDCSQLGLGVNSFISAHLHRGKHWQLTLPTTKTIVGLIKKCRARYPGEKIKMFKLDFSRWYRLFGIDIGKAPFFAIGLKGLTYLDSAMSFGNRAAALAAQ